MSGESDDDTTSYTASEPKTATYLPPSVVAKRVNWDVFLSFTGDDVTCQKFTASLHESLKSKDLRPYMNTVKSSLDEVIEDSALAIAIISPKYAESRCCLDELSSMFKSDDDERSTASKKKEEPSRVFESKKRVIPVFYGVNPSEVRKQSGEFGKRFQKLLNDSPQSFSEEEIEKWRSALKNVGNISGYTCQNQRQLKCFSNVNDSVDHDGVIRRIVHQVWCEVKNTPEYVVKVDVGLDVRVNEVVNILNLGHHDVRFLNIHGTPGIGKTTLAKAVYNRLAKDFKKRCFISNVRERLANEEGILSVQNELIKGLSLENVQSTDDGKAVIKRIVRQNRVLLVLDDVLEAEQLDDLGIDKEWFHEGSRMIVTSRNKDALPGLPCGDELYEVEKLNASESLELFSIHALGRSEPTRELQDISNEIVSLTGGLPLALEVFGSSLVKKTKREWVDALTKLQHIDRPQDLQQVLKISYDALDDEEKTVFLDISCLLLQMDMERENIVDVLASCSLNAELAIANLVTKSLLKITRRNTLWMHDQIRDMGRQIVIQENSDDIWKRSRLWDSVNTMSALQQGKVTEDVRGIVLNIKKPPDFTDDMLYWFNFRRNPSIQKISRYLVDKCKELTSPRNLYDDDDDDDKSFNLNANWFKNLKQLNLLQMDYAKLQGDFKDMPSELRWWQWKGCPQKTLPPNIPKELRVLDLSSSNIEQLWVSNHSWWSSNKVVGNLVVLNLSYCPKLTALPDMSGHKHLKKLNLQHCVGLTKVHESIGQMSSLEHLNLHGCRNLVDLPKDVTGLKGLKELTLSDCPKFSVIPQNIGSMTSLNRLILDRTSTATLPDTLFHLTHLEVLSLKHCHQLTHLPEFLESPTFLKELSLDFSKIEELPCSIGYLTHLEYLNLVHCSSLAVLPDSLGNMKTLTELFLSSSSITKLPSSIGSLHCLRILSLGMLTSLQELPVSIGGLTSMVDLDLDNTPIKVLPEEICSLISLEKLTLNHCTKLEKLPESIGQLCNLTTLLIEDAAITQLPESIGDMEKLAWLKLSKCTKLSSLPHSIGKLSSLRQLIIDETAITSLPETFGLLSGLWMLKMKKSSNKDAANKLELLPDSFCELRNLEEFDARACGISGEINDDFAKLSKLEVLDLGFNCFHSLPSSLKSLDVLKKLVLWQCKELKVLPELPSTLEELNAADCDALERVCDVSNLQRLQELRLANCTKIKDVPGLEFLKSLRRLFMGGSDASASAFRRRLSKVALKNMNTLSVPGSEIPSWFSQTAVSFVRHRNLALKNVMLAVVVSVNIQLLDDIRAQLPDIVDIKARIIRLDEPIFTTALCLTGLPCTTEDQLYLCRFKEYHPLVSKLKEGDIIQLGWSFNPVDGIQLKRWGIHLVFENDDDYEGDEDSLSVTDSEQSVSHRLAMFFRSMDQT